MYSTLEVAVKLPVGVLFSRMQYYVHVLVIRRSFVYPFIRNKHVALPAACEVRNQ